MSVCVCASVHLCLPAAATVQFNLAHSAVCEYVCVCTCVIVCVRVRKLSTAAAAVQFNSAYSGLCVRVCVCVCICNAMATIHDSVQLQCNTARGK